MDLSKVANREALKPRREPYWQRLRPGCFVGYRPSARGGAGTWIGRVYDGDAKSYRMKALGGFGEHPSRDRFAHAKHAAESFAATCDQGSISVTAVVTVEDACRQLANDCAEAASRFMRYVYSDPVAKLKLDKLRRSHLLAWRERLRETPALVSRCKNGERRTRPRSPATLNRDMATLRTALGRVLSLGTPHTDAAWQEALKPERNAVKRRTLYLNLEQRRALLSVVEAEAEPFVRALCLLPLRPGAAAALTVGHFDLGTSELTINKDKSGAARRILVSAAATRLLNDCSKDKLPTAYLFTRANGKAWDKETWNDPLKAAAFKAKLPLGVTAYTLRHSTITDLVCSGLPLLTVAQISGTSAGMIEQHYGHLVRHAAVEALTALAV